MTTDVYADRLSKHRQQQGKFARATPVIYKLISSLHSRGVRGVDYIEIARHA